MKPRDAGSELTGLIPVTNLQFRHTTPAYDLDWHPAPRRQLVMTLSGESEIELEGGRTMRFGPGHILLAEDTTGQGHKSRAVEGSTGSRSTSRWPRARHCRSDVRAMRPAFTVGMAPAIQRLAAGAGALAPLKCLIPGPDEDCALGADAEGV